MLILICIMINCALIYKLKKIHEIVKDLLNDYFQEKDKQIHPRKLFISHFLIF